MANSSRYEYEVFLSFRGEDTRTSFTDFLYTSMIDAGIRVYKDDKELRKGENFGPKLLQAINQSKISIPIFSKGYASSVWCLKELVQMVECQKTRGQKIMPIFYDVAPSEVRHQIRGYGEAFLTHENKERYDEETLRKWKAALTTVGELDGWDLQKMANRKEGEMAKTVTQKVFNELKKAYLVVSNNLVGVDSHVDKIMKEMGAHINETRIIGIHGMGGIGKTTIAKIIYNELSNKYDNCCFLSNIHETSKLKGIEYLQQQLIHDILKTKWVKITNIDEGIKTIKERLPDKKVLLLLDDVEEKDHMDALVGKRDWFGKGSKLIVTTRRKDVLCVPKVDWRYELTCLDPNLSLQLFSKHAFRRESPEDDYISQSERAIRIAGGLPLAIEVIGSLLSDKNKEKWDDTLKMLESVPHDKVQNKLKISYDALDNRQQRIFLDIACHFIGCCKDIVVYFWDASKLFPEATVEVLQNMSLIKIGEDNILWMHDQLRDLGREIVRQESEMNIEKQRWVWNPEDGLNLLRIHEEKKEVEALHLKFDDQRCFTYKDFKGLPNLTFLEVDDLKKNFRAEKMLLGLKWPSYALPTNIFQRNSNLLPRLRWLSWHNIRPTFKIANFSVENLIILDLSRSEITHDWKGWSHMKVIKDLKVLNLAHCQRLKTTPNFSAHSNLEHLILSRCESLIKIDRSICQLKRLVFLDVSDCSKLHRLPETIGNLESLIELNISSTRIKELPDSIEKLRNLKIVNMQYSDISKIHDSFWTMEKLEIMKLICRIRRIHYGHVEFGDCIYENKSLRILRLGEVRIHALPRLPESLIELELRELRVDTFPDLSNLANLKVLDLEFGPPNCDGKSDGLLEEPIPWWIGNLSKLESLTLHFPRMTASSTDLSLPPHPRRLPRLPSSLSSLDLLCFHSLCSMDLSNLRKLSSLQISDSAVAEIEGLGCLENLRELYLYCVEQMAVLPDLSKLNKLRRIQVTDCGNLVEIQGELPRFLDELTIYYCDSLQEFPDLFSLISKTDVYVHICNQLFESTGGHRLLLRGFKQMQIPDLSNCNRLTYLSVESCHNLVEIQGELPQSLETLWIQCCESLQKLPDLSSLKGLREVTIRCCGKLAEEIFQPCSEESIKFVGEDDEDEEDKLPVWPTILRYERGRWARQ
ncbi:disease resistance protein RPV1-like [Eucalyptus grandis]|uniref:disease resistance protein RPV1-like n=1 Tax=Eucalyptus grandis TaxID=71139 RepID=UPI00192E78FA|nr:disease resistance protein RPV1-like [Eucalyptus grandis]XP_039156355.1 disease resistance protein RPV1-like [Eucalyptus grandis]XP_039156356.1 disease resistance protein RPV1-like [Eucalyptus grandis]XP_039156357.1 disease resistance protein RPV1-like [Eucalyptus grandis]XP_039156358.1 disease resistance protein RPV1-like [Eucalyptus grandis]XP_039156359.1 disease resistance protein RPV1-like [Eucalyptus grandis]XP_039156360.1 disease resistance protein RPV1-like [Eucalyptus grandis]XP_0